MPTKLPFSPRAQRVLELAHKNARRDGRNIPNTSDLIFGLSQLGQGVAWKVLKRLKIEIETAANESLSVVPYTELVPIAETERRRMSHDYLGTEHLLLAILSDHNNRLSTMITERGLTPDLVRNEILNELDPNWLPPSQPAP